MSRISRRLLYAVFLPALLHVHSAQAQQVLTLESLLEEVHSTNPSLLAARLNAEALATRPRQVSSLPDPTVSASYRPLAVGGFDGVLPAQIEIRQMIPYPGKLRLAGDAARYGAEMAAYESDELFLELAYEVKASFYEVFMLQQHEHHIHAFQRQLDDFEQAATIRYEVGAGPQQAILKAQLERNTLARKLLEISAERRMHIERLARLVNRPDLIAQWDQVLLERASLDLDPALRPEDALVERPEVKAVEAGLNMADAEIAMAKREYLPDFMVGAGIMDMMGSDAGVMPLEKVGSRVGIEFGIVLPLWKGRRDAALEEARLRRRAFEARYEAVQTEIKTEWNELQNRLFENEKALALFRETLMPQAETTLEATLSAYTTGRADFLDLLDARRMILDVDMEYEHTYADYLQTRARLERTAGVMSGSGVAAR
ncbi:MAG: TolC family protein [Rhodothermales bacterium]